MTTDKAYNLLRGTIVEVVDCETAEVCSYALESLYEKARDYDNMLVVAMEQQVARKELEELSF